MHKGLKSIKMGNCGFNSKTNQIKEKYVKITVDPTDENLVIDGSSFKVKQIKT